MLDSIGNDGCDEHGDRPECDDRPDSRDCDEAPEEGVRQRRNRETHQRIHMVALELAEEPGISEVTVAQIAEQSGVSRRTFFRYFRSKEDAVLAGHSRYLDAAVSKPLAVDTVEEALSAIEELGNAVLEQEGVPDLAEHRRINALIANDPAIRSYAVAQDRVVADLFRDNLVAALPNECPGTLELIADLGVTVWRHGWIRWTTQAEILGGETPLESHAAVRAIFRELAVTTQGSRER